MKNPKLWIWLGVAGLLLVGAMLVAPHARANDKPQIPKPVAPLVIEKTDRDYTAALTAAAITFFIMRRQARKRRPVEPLTCPTPPPTTDERVERALELCSK